MQVKFTNGCKHSITPNARQMADFWHFDNN